MLKLLIADDDPFTLQGITSAIAWQDLGIGLVLEASNGSKALDLARRERPELLLTDVRMPKMDGIELAAAYREIEPNCQIIFMSGFSDKEYLKSAIKLRAVSYVEKPIEISELQEALALAVAQCRQPLIEAQARPSTITAAVPLIASELALELTKTQANEERIKELAELAGFAFPAGVRLQTVIIKLRSGSPAGKEQSGALVDYISNLVAGLLTEPNTTGFAAIKDESHLIVHLYDAPGHADMLRDAVERFASNLLDALPDKDMVFLATGKQVAGLKGADVSYRTAAIALQHMFYNGYSVYGYAENRTPAYVYNAGLTATFGALLTGQDIQQALRLVHSLTFDIKQHKNTTVNSVKEIYFQLLLALVRAAGEKDIHLFDNADSSDYLWNVMINFNTLTEMRDFLIQKVERYASRMKEPSPYSSVVGGILEYIHAHYAEEDLSIGQMSEHTRLTTSYLCNRFKQETGQTINHYLTEYRIGKAKELLRDTTLKVADVSSRVGYSNGDYFAKCFRKLTGSNPSEYRGGAAEG